MRRTVSEGIKKLGLPGNFVGYSLGYDFTAEHEWGIRKLKMLLGVDETKAGVNSIKINPDKSEHLYGPVGNNVKFFKTDHCATLIVDINARYYTPSEGNPIPLCGDLKGVGIPAPGEGESAWYEGGFQIVVGEDDIEDLETLYGEILKGNAAVFLSKGSNMFSNPSLHVAIFDRLPASADQTIRQAQEKARKARESQEKEKQPSGRKGR